VLRHWCGDAEFDLELNPRQAPCLPCPVWCRKRLHHQFSTLHAIPQRHTPSYAHGRRFLSLYLEPLPPIEATEIDGVYGKFEPGDPQWWRCARCPDFRLSGGNWRLMLHQGTMRMYYEVTGFSTVASYEVEGKHLRLLNDPHCPYEVGEYLWTLQDGALQLTEIQDQCAIHLRAENLIHLPWISCQPPNTEAAVTDHWMRPAGCG